MNEIDNMNDALVRIGKALSETLSKALRSIQDIVDGLEPYQRYELLHPRKKPRGSIRRKRKRRGYTAKDGFEIGKALHKGMMDGFGQGESEVNADDDRREYEQIRRSN